MNLKLIETEIKPKSNSIRIIPIGDIHLGNINCNIQKLKDTLDWIKNKPDTYIIGMGDYIEGINFTDPRFNPNSIPEEYLRRLADVVIFEKEELVKLLYPVRDRIICMIEGNHERKVRDKYHYDVQEEICKDLNAKNASPISYIRLKFPREYHTRSLVIHAYHGTHAPSEGTTALRQLIQSSRNKEADIFLCAHSHHLITTSEPYISYGRSNLMQRKRYYGVTGSFLESYTSKGENYVEMKGDNPRKTGVLRIDVYPQKKPLDIHMRC